MALLRRTSIPEQAVSQEQQTESHCVSSSAGQGSGLTLEPVLSSASVTGHSLDQNHGLRNGFPDEESCLHEEKK